MKVPDSVRVRRRWEYEEHGAHGRGFYLHRCQIHVAFGAIDMKYRAEAEIVLRAYELAQVCRQRERRLVYHYYPYAQVQEWVVEGAVNQAHQQISRTIGTNAGKCALWQTEYFESTGDPDDWDDWASDPEPLAQAISAGAFVPIGVGADGVFEVLIRWGFSGEGLTERERHCVLVSSEPYLLASPGAVYVGGLEEAGDLPGRDANRIELPRGRYSATIHLIDWKAESEFVGQDGSPLGGALPDFVVEIRPEEAAGKHYRIKSATFDRT